MPRSLRERQLRDAYRFPGFFSASTVYAVFGDPRVRVLTLHRRQKNSVWNLWGLAPQLLRPEVLFGARLVLWRASHLSGVARAPSKLPEVLQGKTRDRKSVAQGKRVDLFGSRILKNKHS